MDLSRPPAKDEWCGRAANSPKNWHNPEFTHGPQTESEDIRFVCLILYAPHKLILGQSSRVVEEGINCVLKIRKSGHDFKLPRKSSNPQGDQDSLVRLRSILEVPAPDSGHLH